MIRLIAAFIITFLLTYTAVEAFRMMTGRELWSLTKTVLYSIMLAAIAVGILSAIVIAF